MRKITIDELGLVYDSIRKCFLVPNAQFCGHLDRNQGPTGFYFPSTNKLEIQTLPVAMHALLHPSTPISSCKKAAGSSTVPPIQTSPLLMFSISTQYSPTDNHDQQSSHHLALAPA
jgi:hypothetical protein